MATDSPTKLASTQVVDENNVHDLTSLLITTTTIDAAAAAQSSTSTMPSTPKKKDKINLLLKPVGDAPILKQKLWAVDPDKQVSGILLFIRNYLRLEADQSLFIFINQAFAPSPDQLLRNLYECFGSDGKLILHYSTTVAWG